MIQGKIDKAQINNMRNKRDTNSKEPQRFKRIREYYEQLFDNIFKNLSKVDKVLGKKELGDSRRKENPMAS